MTAKPFRGMVVEVSLDPVVGHEQGRTRPCVVVQNDIGNRFASTTIVVPLTDAAHIRTPSPIYVLVKKGDGGATKDSYVLCDQIRTVDQRRFKTLYGTLSPSAMAQVDAALLISLGLSSGLQRPWDPSEAK
jgi:mRNA interferase MazF